MLLSLIAVLVLLVIALYALWMAITGRIGGSDNNELSAGGRVVIAGVALMAFGIAYAAYHPLGKLGEAPANGAVASAPEPEAPTPAGLAQAVRANPMPVGRTSDTAAPATDEVAAVDETSEAPEAVSEKPVVMTAASRSGGLSESAAAMETAANRAPAAAVAAPAPRKVIAAPAAAAAEQVLAPAAAPRRSTGPARRSRQPYGPLLIHIDNQLGADQRSEQLTLRIEGKPVADIDIDSQRPAVAVAVSLPRPGRLHYRLEGLSDDGIGTRVKGEGCIRVDDGARYVVRRKPGSRKVFLERVKTAR